MSCRILWAVALVVAALLQTQVSPVAADTASATTITAIVVGGAHACALTSEGNVWCWGANADGQLGNGTTTDSSVPVYVSGLPHGITAISGGGRHTCALTSNGRIKCWGHNDSGELGVGTTISSSVPMDAIGLTSGINAIAAGGDHTCSLTSDGAVKCWGADFSAGLFTATTPYASVPFDVVGLADGVAAVSAGDFHTCALTDGGLVKCWGNNDYGQLGDGTTTGSAIPVAVAGLPTGILAIAAGVEHTCALTRSGGIECWGANYWGQLGNGTMSETGVLTPVGVQGLSTGVIAIATGSAHTCALTSAGAVKCWGYKYMGALGNGTTGRAGFPTPVDVVGLSSGITAISAGSGLACALTSGGAVKCWGANYFGGLGDGTTRDSLVPVDVDFAAQRPPLTDAAVAGSHEGPADIPLLPVLAGLGGGIALLARRRVVPAPHPVEGKQTDPGS